MVRKALAVVDAAAMQVAVAGFQQALPLGPAGAAQPQLDLGKILPEAPDRFREDRLYPKRIGGCPDTAGAAGQGAADPVLGLLEGAQQAPGLRRGLGAQRGRPARPWAGVRTAARRTGSPAGRWRGSAPAGSWPAGRPRRRSSPPRPPPPTSPTRCAARTWRRRRTIRPQDRIRNVNRPGRQP